MNEKKAEMPVKSAGKAEAREATEPTRVRVKASLKSGSKWAFGVRRPR